MANRIRGRQRQRPPGEARTIRDIASVLTGRPDPKTEVERAFPEYILVLAATSNDEYWELRNTIHDDCYLPRWEEFCGQLEVPTTSSSSILEQRCISEEVESKRLDLLLIMSVLTALDAGWRK